MDKFLQRPYSETGESREAWRARWTAWRDTRFEHYRRLGLPIPGIRKSRGGPGCWRCPRTTQELRMIAGARVDGEPYRAARRQLPGTWDDLMSGCQRTWKKHRRTRWK